VLFLPLDLLGRRRVRSVRPPPPGFCEEESPLLNCALPHHEVIGVSIEERFPSLPSLRFLPRGGVRVPLDAVFAT